jgi:hypothetical protein
LVTNDNVKALEAKVIDLAPQHVRIFVHTSWWSPAADPQLKESVLRTIGLAQRAGATVNLTLWHGPYEKPAECSRAFADMVNDLIRNHQLTAIKYLTIQNEPNSTKVSLEKYNTLYRSLDQSLRDLHLRDKINIVGGDLLSEEQEMWFKDLQDNLADVCDGYSIHMYSDYWDDDHILKRLVIPRKIVDDMPPEKRRPMYIMEFGVRGHRQGNEEPGRTPDGTTVYDTTIAGVQNAWVILEALNRGYVAMCQWEIYDAIYDRSLMPYGTIGDVTSGWKKKPTFWLTRLFTHSCAPGWRALRVGGNSRELIATAMLGRESEMTIYILNRREQAEPIHISGLPPGKAFRQQIWNKTGDGTNSFGQNVIVDLSRHIHLIAPPRAMIALTAK